MEAVGLAQDTPRTRWAPEFWVDSMNLQHDLVGHAGQDRESLFPPARIRIEPRRPQSRYTEQRRHE